MLVAIGYNPDQNMAGFNFQLTMRVAMVITLTRTWQALFQLAMLVAMVTTLSKTWQALFQLMMLAANGYNPDRYRKRGFIQLVNLMVVLVFPNRLHFNRVL